MDVKVLRVWGTGRLGGSIRCLISLSRKGLVLFLIVHEALQIVFQLSPQISSMLLNEVSGNEWEVIVLIFFLHLIILLFLVRVFSLHFTIKVNEVLVYRFFTELIPLFF